MTDDRVPTHILHVQVALDLSEEQQNGDIDRTLADALTIILAASALAYRGAYVTDPIVTVESAEDV